MKKRNIYSIFLALAVVLSSCGSNEKEDEFSLDAKTSTGAITTSLQTISIDKDNGNIVANVAIKSMYTNTAIANLSDMNIVLNECPMELGTLVVNPGSVILDNKSPTKNVEFTGTMIDASCVPTSYHLTGSNALVENAQTTKTPFTTDSVNIDSNAIIFNAISLLKIEVLDKRLDINESNIESPIRIRVTQGSIGINNKKVKVSSLVTEGSFISASVLSDDAGDATFTYKAPNSMVDNNFTVQFCLEEDSTVCDTVKINLTTGAIVPPVDVIDDINYFITYVPKGGVYNLGLNARNNAVVTLIDKDTIDKDTIEAIPTNRIRSISVTSRDASVLKITPEGGGIPVSNISFGAGRNGASVLMTADSVNSGLATIAVVIKYINKNGELQTRGQLFSVTVHSGEPTAFSINSDGVTYNSGTKQFEHQFIVQATDASSNPISSTGIINVSAMASFAKDAAGREMLYGRFSARDEGISANLIPDGSTARLSLVGGLTPFNTTNIKENRAFVAVFGSVDTYEANGKWNIEKGSLAGDTLKFSNAYTGEPYAELGIAVGYNFRNKFCTSTFEESVIVVDSTDGTYELNEQGQAVVTLKHDAYMIGKRVMILVNMTGLNPKTGEVKRSGEVHELTLTHSLPLKERSITIPKNASNLPITIAGVIDTGTEDEYGLINSTFSCSIEGDTGITSIGAITRSDPDLCISGGLATLTVLVSATEEGGIVTFSRCRPDSEPIF